MCGFITIPNTCSGKHSVRDETRDPQSSKIPHLNSFKSTECLLLSLLRKEPKEIKEDYEASWKSSSEELADQTQRAKKLQQHKLASKQGSADNLIGGSCQNLSGFRNEQGLSLTFKTRCYSLERIGNTASRVHNKGELDSLRKTNVLSTRNEKQWLPCVSKTDSVLEFGFENTFQKQTDGSKRVSAPILQDRELFKENLKSKQICRSQGLLGSRSSRSCTSINVPIAEITVKPRSQLCGQGRPNTSVATSVGIRTEVSDITVSKRLCRSTIELSECSFTHSYVLTGTQSKMALQSMLYWLTVLTN